MAEVKEVFPIVADFASEEGQSLHSIQEGVAPSTRRGSIGFAFKDSSGNVVLPQLDSEGKLPVTSEGAGIEIAANGELAAGSTSMVDITSATLTLTADAEYNNLQFVVSSFRESVFHLVQIDDAATTILARVRVGPGQYTFLWNGGKRKIVAGSTGTQTLKIQGQNLDKASAMSADLSAVEIPA